jgi:hypothetical protein
MTVPSVGNLTQVVEAPREDRIVPLALTVNPRVPVPVGLPPQGNIPQRVHAFIQTIDSDLFTPEQRVFAVNFERQFAMLQNHANPLTAPRALAFLGIEVVTPSITRYQNNIEVLNLLAPIVAEHRELLALLLPDGTDVEGFIIQNEETHELMIRTTAQMNEVAAMYQGVEKTLCETATQIRDAFVQGAVGNRNALREQAQQWNARIAEINSELTQLTRRTEQIFQQSQEQSRQLETIGKKLADKRDALDVEVNQLKDILGKV